MYKSLGNGFKVTIAEGGAAGLFLGWAPTAIGYSAQGLCKFGFYEVFKDIYSKAIGEENTFLYRTSLYLASSASAEFFADIALSPMEACKVRIQTSPVGTFPTTLRGAFRKILKEEGPGGFYKSIVPLWGRQIPYTMMKFACFERTVEAIYANIVPKPRAECTKGEQLIVTFAAGYIAGVFCAVVSHPADTIVSYMNKASGSGIGDAARALGFSGMWAGLGPRIIMIGTLTALQWKWNRRCGKSSRILWYVGWPRTKDHYDWYPHCATVVHLCWCKGPAETSPPTPTRDARVPQDQVGYCPGIGARGFCSSNYSRQIDQLFKLLYLNHKMMLLIIFCLKTWQFYWRNMT